MTSVSDIYTRSSTVCWSRSLWELALDLNLALSRKSPLRSQARAVPQSWLRGFEGSLGPLEGRRNDTRGGESEGPGDRVGRVEG